MKISQDYGGSWGPSLYFQSEYSPYWYSDVEYSGNTILVAWNGAIQNGETSVIFNKSYDGDFTWDGEYWIDRDIGHSQCPALAASKGVFYIVWYEARYNSALPAGLYFSRWPDWPDAVDDDGANALPVEVTLAAHPNPFNGATTISYQGVEGGGSLHIYDITGRRVRTLDLDQPSGSVAWDATGDGGGAMASGVCIARAIGRGIGNTANIKVIYLK